MAIGLEIVGALDILAGDEPVRVDFRGDVVAVTFRGVRSALGVGRGMTRRGRRDGLRRLQAILGSSGLELQIWVGRRQVGRLAAGTRPGRLATAFGLGPMEWELRSLLASLARRRSGGGTMAT